MEAHTDYFLRPCPQASQREELLREIHPPQEVLEAGGGLFRLSRWEDKRFSSSRCLNAYDKFISRWAVFPSPRGYPDQLANAAANIGTRDADGPVEAEAFAAKGGGDAAVDDGLSQIFLQAAIRAGQVAHEAAGK